MPHAPWCPRNRRPSVWLRLRYGALASLALKLMYPCRACDEARRATAIGD